jgi:hypothetical protein
MNYEEQFITKADYPKAGIVQRAETRVIRFDVTIDMLDGYEADGQAEYVITINGRVVKRMDLFAAQRFGLVER